MTDYINIHNKLSEAFYKAKKEGKITPELQAAFDKAHADNWKSFEASVKPAEPVKDKPKIVTPATITELKTVIGDWTK